MSNYYFIYMMIIDICIGKELDEVFSNFMIIKFFIFVVVFFYYLCFIMVVL